MSCEKDDHLATQHNYLNHPFQLKFLQRFVPLHENVGRLTTHFLVHDMAGILHCMSRVEKTTVVLALLRNCLKICPLVVDLQAELVTVDR